MQVRITFVGEHAHLPSPDEIAAGIAATSAVFASHDVDPLACAATNAKLENDQALTKDEARLCVIWQMTDDKAFRAMTLGWLKRDTDIGSPWTNRRDRIMNVEQLIAALQQIPAQAVVLLEGDAGCSLVGGIAFEENGNGVPDEMILLPSMEDD